MTELEQEYNYTPLAKPLRITEHNWPEGTVPLVTIRCITYNHVNFIRDAIEGFLMQETTFPVEILIHDDASTDGTAEIVRDYEARYPWLIKAIYQTENQYSKGNKPGQFLRPLRRGKYIAMCEGDDYWTDPKKLEIQVGYLEENSTLDIAFHPAIQINQETAEKKIIGRYRTEDGVVPLSQIITKRYGMIPTASTCVRKEILNCLDDFMLANPYLTVGDIYLSIFGAKRGGAWYTNGIMSTYRSMATGSWNKRRSESLNSRTKHRATRIHSFLLLKKAFPEESAVAFDCANYDYLIRLLREDQLKIQQKLGYLIKYREFLYNRGFYKFITRKTISWLRKRDVHV